MSNKGFKLNKDFEQYNESMALGKPIGSPSMLSASTFGKGMKSNALSAVSNATGLSPETLTNAIMIGQLAKQNQRGLTEGSIGGINKLKLAAILGILALSTAGGLYMYGEHKLNKRNKQG